MASCDIVLEADDALWLPMDVMNEVWRRALPTDLEPITWGEVVSREGVVVFKRRTDDGKEQD